MVTLVAKKVSTLRGKTRRGTTLGRGSLHGYVRHRRELATAGWFPRGCNHKCSSAKICGRWSCQVSQRRRQSDGGSLKKPGLAYPR